MRQFPLPRISAETPFVWNLCRSCVLPWSLLFQMCISPTVSERCFFLDIIHHLWLLQSFFLLFCIASQALMGWEKFSMQIAIFFLKEHTQEKWHSVIPVLTQLSSWMCHYIAFYRNALYIRNHTSRRVIKSKLKEKIRHQLEGIFL